MDHSQIANLDLSQFGTSDHHYKLALDSVNQVALWQSGQRKVATLTTYGWILHEVRLSADIDIKGDQDAITAANTWLERSIRIHDRPAAPKGWTWGNGFQVVLMHVDGTRYSADCSADAEACIAVGTEYFRLNPKAKP